MGLQGDLKTDRIDVVIATIGLKAGDVIIVESGSGFPEAREDVQAVVIIISGYSALVDVLPDFLTFVDEESMQLSACNGDLIAKTGRRIEDHAPSANAQCKLAIAAFHHGPVARAYRPLAFWRDGGLLLVGNELWVKPAPGDAMEERLVMDVIWRITPELIITALGKVLRYDGLETIAVTGANHAGDFVAQEQAIAIARQLGLYDN